MAKDEPTTVPRFVCAKEASALLNCIAANEYAEHKCLERMKQLRKCTQKERVVSFNLLPDAEQGTSTTSHAAAPKQEETTGSGGKSA